MASHSHLVSVQYVLSPHNLSSNAACTMPIVPYFTEPEELQDEATLLIQRLEQLEQALNTR